MKIEKKYKLKIDFFYLFSLISLTSIFFWKIFFGLRLDVIQRMKVPFSKEGDSLFNLFLIKGLCDNSWLPYFGIYSPRLNAPTSLNMLDHPLFDNFFFCIWFIMSKLCSNPFFILNSYFFFTYILTAISFYILCRYLNFHFFTSFLLAILYSFLPYHFFRYDHIFLASYFFVPWMCLILLSFWEKNPPFFNHQENKCAFFSSKKQFALLIFLFASSGIYYCFFFCFLALIASLSGSIYQKKLTNLKSGFFCITTIIVSLALNALPNLIKIIRWGKNPEALLRAPTDAEVLGLKIINLILPAITHRWSFFNDLRMNYHSGTPVCEGFNEYLGLICLAGLLYLLIEILRVEKRLDMMKKLSILMMFSILLGTIGGIGSIFSYLVTPEFRGLNRISIFIATFGLIAAGKGIEFLKRKMPFFIWSAFCGILLMIGIIDQNPKLTRINDEAVESHIYDDLFFKKMESNLPPESTVLQLPYASFPEYPSVHKMTDYQHIKAFIYTKKLRFSYGSLKGTKEATEMQVLSALPLNLKHIREKGFQVIYIDRFGFEDNAKEIESFLTQNLKQFPIVSDDSRRSYFVL
jgi:phosphoglycerol transferase